MQAPKSLLIGLAALPWAEAFGTMPHKKPKVDDPFAGLGDLEDVNTAGESAQALNQQYITVKGSSTKQVGAEVCAEVVNKPGSNPGTQLGIAGCYRHITVKEKCEAAAATFSDPNRQEDKYSGDADGLWDPARGSFHDITDESGASDMPADCYQITQWNGHISPKGTLQFYWNYLGDDATGIGDAPWKKVKFVCEYFCPEQDLSECTTCTCYANDAAQGCTQYTDYQSCFDATCEWGL